MKSFFSEEEYNKKFEQDFQDTVEMVGYYQGNIERETIDGEWTEGELKSDLWDEANKLLNGYEDNGKKVVGWLEKHKGRLLKNEDLTHTEFVVNDIIDRYDLVEVYNRAYDIHKNDKPRLFGIHYFDELARAEVLKVLNGNLVC